MDAAAAGRGAGGAFAVGQPDAGEVTQEEAPVKQPNKQEQRGPSEYPAFDFILNPDWESVEEDYSDESE